MKLEKISVTLLADNEGEFEIAACRGSTIVGIHWKSWQNGPYYNGPINPHHIEKSVQDILNDGRVWVDKEKHPEYLKKIVSAVKFIHSHTTKTTFI